MSAIIRKALENVAYDNGMVNRIDGEPDWRLPPAWRPYEEQIDAELSALTEAELETLCVGEHDDLERVAMKAPWANRMLASFFEDWAIPPYNADEAQRFLSGM